MKIRLRAAARAALLCSATLAAATATAQEKEATAMRVSDGGSCALSMPTTTPLRRARWAS